MEYFVYANHDNHMRFLGLASGTEEDIRAYFDNQKAYGLELKPAITIEVPFGYKKELDSLLKEKTELEFRLREIERKIKIR